MGTLFVSVLRTCPFCDNFGIEVTGDYMAGYHARCMQCDASGPNGNTESEAAEKWNRRPREDAARDAASDAEGGA